MRPRPGVAAWLAAALVVAGCGKAERQPDISGIVGTCTSCHGPDGKSSGIVPSIHGLSEAEILRAFDDFAMGERESTVMSKIISAYSEDEIRAVAKYFGNLSQGDR